MNSGVIVGYDGSDCAKEALRVAMEVGKAYGDAVTIAFAYDLNQMAGEIQDYAAALKELATKRIAEGAALANASGEGAGVTVHTAIVERAPAHGLVELAQRDNARVIVVGTHGESPLRGALLGSTPHKLLQLADRPVLVVPAPST
jgi:nucleotide-binding universal stress UspA family protein